MFYALCLLWCADLHHLGRVSIDTLPQQALMELLIDDMQNTNRFYDENGDCLDIAQWPRTHFDEDGSVQIIDWIGMDLSGSTNFQWLPATVTECDFRWNALRGSLHFDRLPKKVENLYLSTNSFSGSIDLTCLPAPLRRLDVAYNQLSGTLNLCALPDGLQRLHLAFNGFTGSVDLSRIPKGMHHFSIANNKLSGVLDMRMLTQTKNFFYANNKFNEVIRKVQTE